MHAACISPSYAGCIRSNAGCIRRWDAGCNDGRLALVAFKHSRFMNIYVTHQLLTQTYDLMQPAYDQNADWIPSYVDGNHEVKMTQIYTQSNTLINVIVFIYYYTNNLEQKGSWEEDQKQPGWTALQTGRKWNLERLTANNRGDWRRIFHSAANEDG